MANELQRMAKFMELGGQTGETELELAEFLMQVGDRDDGR